MSPSPHEYFQRQLQDTENPTQFSLSFYNSDTSTNTTSYQPYPENFHSTPGFMESAPSGQFDFTRQYQYNNYDHHPQDHVATDYRSFTGSGARNYVRDYGDSQSFSNAPVAEPAFRSRSQHTPQSAGGRGTSLDNAAQALDYWSEPSQFIPDEQSAAALNTNGTRSRFWCSWPGCDKSFGRKPDLDRHYNSLHFNPRQHSCPDCGRTFNRKDNLTAHILNVHVGVLTRS